jgi:hypothetical protein
VENGVEIQWKMGHREDFCNRKSVALQGQATLWIATHDYMLAMTRAL